MKKLLLLLCVVVIAGSAGATNYYVSASGNDASNGTSAATPWKTIAKVNSFTFAANDSILFKRGDTFFGSVIVGRNNLNFSAYGTGARPLITGFVTLSSWTSVSTGIYSAPVNAKSSLNMVTLNGNPQQIGRYPNAGDANGGYLTFESASSTSVTDNEMTSAINWTGAEIAIRKNEWAIERCIITNHTNGTFTYRIGRNANAGNTPTLYAAKLNYGYFIQDDPRTLDQIGEWYFDTTQKKLLMYFGSNTPSNYNVQVSVVDTLMNMAGRTNISVSEMNFEGANMSGIFSYYGGYITIKNCNFVNIGSRGIQIFASNDVLIDGVNVTNALSNGIQSIARVKDNATVRNCIVKNVAPFPGMASFFDESDHKGIYVITNNNTLIEYNQVDSTGLSGIQFQGNNVVVQYNVVNHFCATLDDVGGIYTFVGGTDASPAGYYTNRVIRNNIVMNGIGNEIGTPNSSSYVGGIFLDGRTMNVSVLDNTVFNVAKRGLHSNNPSNVTIRGNTFFNNAMDISFMRWAWGSINNLNIKKNISFPFDVSQKNIYYTNAGLNTPVTTALETNVQSLGSIDSNYYNTFNDASIQCEIYNTEGGALLPTSPYSLGGWRDFSNYDLKSKKPARQYEPYTLLNTIGANRFTNSTFNSNITGVTLYGTATTASYDNTSKITGTGSLRMDFVAPQANKYSFIHGRIGAVSSSSKYILRFKMLGTTANGIVRAFIRLSNSPYTDMVPRQVKAFGTSIITQEFLFDGPPDQAEASFVIEIEQMSGTTYIDDIEFYEVNATINTPASQIRFEYNAANTVKTVTLDAKYMGVDSTIYNGTLTLQPFSSKVMVKIGPIDNMPMVNAGSDKIIYMPVDSVQLAGSASGGTITSYAWSKITGPAQFTIVSPGSASTTIKNLVIGTYKFELKATNNAGLFSRDTLSVIVSSVLPVKLVSFIAAKSNSQAALTWVTTGEINSDSYIIERSADGRSFKNIGQVLSNNREEQSTYNFTDTRPLDGINYYRLKMLDKDGAFTYSKVVTATFEGSSQSFELVKAAIHNASVKLAVSSGKQQTLNIIAADAAGRVVMKRQVQLNAGDNTIENHIPSVSTAVYYIKLFTGEHSIVKAILSE